MAIKIPRTFITSVKPNTGAVTDYECWQYNKETRRYRKLGWKPAKTVREEIIKGRPYYTARLFVDKDGDKAIEEGEQIVCVLRTKGNHRIWDNIQALHTRGRK